MAEHNLEGKWGEQVAAEWLCKKGYLILNRNWRAGTNLVDLDIVCQTPDGQYTVFVEVKTRSNTNTTEPEDAVNIKKIRNLGRVADSYVKQYDVANDIRFDIITIVGQRNSHSPIINQIEDAFNPLLV